MLIIKKKTYFEIINNIKRKEVSTMDPEDYDRTDVNESDGQVFYGYDSDDGTTAWYTADNTLDCITETPSDDEW